MPSPLANPLPAPMPPAAPCTVSPAPDTRPELRAQALAILLLTDPAAKCAATTALHADWTQGRLRLDPAAALSPPPGCTLPGRPERPRLVEPTAVPTRSAQTTEGRAALLHAICHIEFNAINLALDALWRFAHLPEAYYADWLHVAQEEARHFEMLHRLLQSLPPEPRAGVPASPHTPHWCYGSFDAHDGLWTLCAQTAHDPIARMALVPRTLEARGLDATPLIQAKLRAVAEAEAICEALDIILRDEVGHVAIGNRWYHWLCAQRGLEPRAHHRTLAHTHKAPRPKPPLNTAARAQAGFSPEELAELLQPDPAPPPRRAI